MNDPILENGGWKSKEEATWSHPLLVDSR